MLKIESEQKVVVANLIGQIGQEQEEKTKATAKLIRMEPEIREQVRSEMGGAKNRIDIAEARALLAKSLEESAREELEKVGRDAKLKLDAEMEQHKITKAECERLNQEARGRREQITGSQETNAQLIDHFNKTMEQLRAAEVQIVSDSAYIKQITGMLESRALDIERLKLDLARKPDVSDVPR